MFIVLKQLETALRAMKNYIDKFRPKYIRLEWDNEQNKPVLNADLRSIVEMIEDGIEVIFIIPSNNIPDYNEFNYIRFIRKNTYGEMATYVFKGEFIFPWGEPKKEIELMIDHHIQDDIYNYTLSLDYGTKIYINGQLVETKDIQINIPTKTSDLTNDTEYITEANISKSDWNQNDSTANDYIKNRICYVSNKTEEIELLYGSFNEQHNDITGTIIFPRTISSLENVPYTAILGDSNGIENQDYTVYTGTFTYDQQQQAYQFGDLSNFNISESNGDPFYGTIYNMGDGGGYTITLTTSVSESTPFKLSITIPIVNTLDNKYLNGELLIRGDGIDSVLLNGENAQLRASGKYAVAEGFLSNATGDYSHAEGGSITSGYRSHAEGFSQASQENAHAEGNSQATGYCSHSEGKWTTASGGSSHAEGIESVASKDGSHAEGQNTTASGLRSHSEGDQTTASGDESHAEGAWTTASGIYSHAEGYGTTANHQAQHAFGIYNIPDANAANADKKGTYIEIVGNGASKTVRSNARTLDWNGNEWLAGNLKVGGTGYDDPNAKTIATLDTIAPEFSDQSSYAAGSYVLKNGVLYKFTSDHTAGAWTGSDVAVVTVGGEVEGVKSDLDNISNILEIPRSLFDASTFAISNTSNWAILSKTPTSISVENLRGYSTGYPNAPLSNIPNGTYVFHGDFTDSEIKYFTLRKNGSTVKNIADGDTFVIDDTTYSISFTTGVTGVYTITDISVMVSGGEKNAIEVLQESASEQEADINNYVKANAEYKTIELLDNYTANQILNASGEVITAGSNIYCVSDFIQVLPGDKLLLTETMYRNNVVMAFYKSDGTFISAVKGEAGTLVDTNVYQFSDFSVVIPSEAAKMKISFITALGTVIYYPRSLKKITGYNLIGVNYKWMGLKWVCVGDSLTEHNIRTDVHYYDYISEKTGITPVVMGASGSGYARLSDQNKAFYQRISDIPTDADVVTIFGSFNDLGASLPIGSIDDTGTDTIAGCINTTITNLQTVIPLVNLGIVAPTPWSTTPPSTTGTAFEYVEMIKAICEKRSIPFLDLWRSSNLRPWDSDFRALAYSKDEGAGTHPDENGHKLIAPRFEGFLNFLLLD